MIIHAEVVWKVGVTLDVPEDATPNQVRDKVYDKAAHELPMVAPEITKCIERPEIIG